MVVVSIVISAIIIFSSFVWGAGGNIPLSSAIGPYTRSLLLLIVTRCLPMIPILIIMYFIGGVILNKYKLSIIALIFMFIGIYIILGLGLFGGNFWQIHHMLSGDFSIGVWFKSEQRDLFFSLSSLLGSFYFVWKSFYSDRAMQLH